MQVRVSILEAYIMREASVLCSAFLLSSVFRVHLHGFRYGYLEATSLSTCYAVEELAVWQTMTSGICKGTACCWSGYKRTAPAFTLTYNAIAFILA
jgi:hypothetical protein